MATDEVFEETTCPICGNWTWDNTDDWIEKDELKEVKEFHQKGMLSIENLELIQDLDKSFIDVGLQIADDGRIWLCVDGVAFIRFKPRREKHAQVEIQ